MSTWSSLGWGGGKEKMHQQPEAPSSSFPPPTYLGEAAEGGKHKKEQRTPPRDSRAGLRYQTSMRGVPRALG